MNILKSITEIKELPTLPDVVSRIVSCANDDKTDVMDLSRILANDPSLSAQTLKLANSAYYSLGTPVTTIKEAIVVLGFNTVKQLALAAGVSDIFETGTEISGLSGKALWKHSIACALCSEVIAEYVNAPKVSELFTMGMLHDIGIVIVLKLIGKEYAVVVERAKVEKKTLSEVELVHISADHGSVGWKLLSSWGIPDKVSSVIRFHHTPERAAEELKLPACIIYLSDIICRYAKMGFDGEFTFPPVKKYAVNALGLDKRKPDFPANAKPEPEHIKAIVKLLKPELDKARDFLDMVK